MLYDHMYICVHRVERFDLLAVEWADLRPGMQSDSGWTVAGFASCGRAEPPPGGLLPAASAGAAWPTDPHMRRSA